MALIYEIIKTLQADELKKISAIPMQDREREVLQFMLKINKKVFPSSTACNQLHIQSSHLDKINSILFKRAIEVLAGENIFDQIAWLSAKSGLWNISKHILKSYELKNINEHTTAEDLLKFYTFCFEWYVSLPFSHQDIKQLTIYIKKILRYCPAEKRIETKIRLRIILLRRQLKLITSEAHIKLESYRTLLRNKLHIILLQTKQVHVTAISYQAHLLGMVLYTLLEDYKKSNEHYKEITALLRAHPADFTENDRQAAELYHAQTLYHASAFTACYDAYSKIFHHFQNGEPARWFMYYAEYMQVSLLTCHYETAKTICETFFASFGDESNGSLCISSHLQILKYLLFTEQYEKALKTIRELEKHISKTSLLQFQFVARELTIAWHYLQNDTKKADALAEKNLKFFRFKKIHKNIPEYTYHSRMVRAICKSIKTQKPLTKKEMMMFDYMQKGTMAQYGFLLNRFYKTNMPD